MLPRERVQRVIRHERPDRLPVYGWLRANLEPQIKARFGAVEAFEDKYEFDVAHLFGGPHCYVVDESYWKKFKSGEVIEPTDVVDLPLSDPDDEARYADLKAQIAYYQGQRGRFVYVQTPGIFEKLNSTFQIENHLAYLLLFEDELKEIYRKNAEWNRRFAMNCLDLGVDMIHVSDDWGGQDRLLFSPEVWWRMIYPYHRTTADAVKARGAYLSLHSDGNINAVMEGVLQLGFDVVHPWQESAGMSLATYYEKYREKFTVMGGIDVQTTLGFGKYDQLASEIQRVINLFRDGGLILCTTHFVQNHCTIEELTFAYDLVYQLIREKP